MKDDRELTSKESTWVKQLKKCLSGMPISLELNVKHTEVAVCNKGAMENALAINSSDDLIVIEFIRTKRINPDSESL